MTRHPPDKPSRRHLRVAYDAQAPMRPPASGDVFLDLIADMGAEQAGEPSPISTDIWDDIFDTGYAMDGAESSTRRHLLRGLAERVHANRYGDPRIPAILALLEVILGDGIEPESARADDGPDGAP